MELFSTKQAGFKLRGYQEAAVNASADFLLRKGKSKRDSNGIIVAPTAAGKSIIIAKTAELAEGRVVVMQPSKELLLQNYDKFTRLGFEAGIYSASAKRKDTDRVTFVTPGSVVDCGLLFKGCKLIIDEAHLFPPKSSSMIGRFMQAAGVEKTLGYTATPFRLDKDELKFLTRMRPALFGSIQHVIQVDEMTSGGYWSKMKYKSIPFDNKHLRMNTAGSDYTEASMRKSYEESGTAETISHICKVAKEHGRKSILVFVPSVADAQALERSIHGLKAVWGDMKTDDRDNVISGFKDGSIQVVANVNVLSVGFDHPGVDCIIMARPTMSLAWYYQAVGRGTRIDPSGVKQDCWVYDLSGNYDRFGRVENIQILEVPGFGWGVFGNTDKRLFTNIPMWAPQKFHVNNVHQLKEYKAALYSQRPW